MSDLTDRCHHYLLDISALLAEVARLDAALAKADAELEQYR